MNSNASFIFVDGDKITSKVGFAHYGIEFSSITHSKKMFGCMDNDKTSATVFIGYGILFTDMNHTLNKEQNWWTLMISLWYPIILFGILPAMYLFKKLCGSFASTETISE